VKSRLRRIGAVAASAKLLIIIIFVMLLLSVVDPNFLTPRSLLNLLNHMSIDGIMVVGMTVLLISGVFDLSIGSVMSLAGITTIFLQPQGTLLSLLGGALVGLVVGLINGILATVAKIQAFIATLGTMIFVKGIALVLTRSVPISGSNAAFMEFAYKSVLGVPVFVYFLALAFAAGWYLLNHTKFGRYAYAIGGNEESARLAGIRVSFYKIAYFVFCSLSASIAGVLLASKTNTGSAIFGDNVPLVIIATVVLGGTSLSGGKGKILGTLQSLVIFGLISKAMVILNIDQLYQYIFRGLVIITVVLADAMTSARDRAITA
jgi:ribose transport system permease protein